MNFQDLLTLDSGFILDAEKAATTAFVGSLHGKAGCTSLNQLQTEKSRRDIAVKTLPPTDDSFH